MFLAAFTSALQAYPQATQRKRAWLSRLSAAMCPHAEQHWLVYAGLTREPVRRRARIRYVAFTIAGRKHMADVEWSSLLPRLEALVERMDHIENYLTELGRVSGHSYGRYSSGIPAEVADLARAGKTMQAIHLYRQLTGASLEQGKVAVAKAQAGGS
jgi:hypothetical protein